MTTPPARIPDHRALTGDERLLVIWLLEHGDPAARAFLAQVDGARVTARCGCGCASVDFDLADPSAKPPHGMTILGEFQWLADQGGLCGVFVFARGAQLAGLEVWSIDGIETPRRLPAPAELHPLGSVRP